MERLLEFSRGVRGACRGIGPDSTKQSTEGFRDSSVHTEGVIRVELSLKYSCCERGLSTLLTLSKAIERTNEVLAELSSVRQALKGRIHETSVSPTANENWNEGVGWWSHILPSPSVPGS